VEFLSRGISNHSPTIISVGTLQSFGLKPFKFYNFWIEHKGFLDWVKEGWNFQVDGFPMFPLYMKLRSVKAVLKDKNMVCFRNLKQKVIQARENLSLAQTSIMDSFGSANSLLKERECLHAYVSITRVEESFLKQKPRNQWLQLGDKNNSFFHRSLKVQNARNTINYLWDEHGNKVDDVEQIKEVAVDFYKNMLGTDQLHFAEAKTSRIKQLIPVAISSEHAAILEKKVYAEEIKDTLFHMKANKAPGPDVFFVDFFKASWAIVGQEVVDAIKGFFNSVSLLREVNAIIISLVPKKVNPFAMGDFRPITCSNVIYKCITKILSNRMLPFLSDLVSKNQSAFIPAKSISENVLLAQELVRGYHKEKGNPRCTLKVDLMKAYDSVNWEFILHCLYCFGFPKIFLGWIRECIITPKFLCVSMVLWLAILKEKRG
jgi:hypothetical protein